MRTVEIVVLELVLLACAGCASEVLKGEVASSKQKQSTLQQELDETKEYLANQDRRNQELVQREAQWRKEEALWQKDTERQRAEAAQREAGLVAANSEWQARFDTLQKKYEESTREVPARNVAFRKIPSVTIVPNNSLLEDELDFGDPRILPARYEGGDLVVELQDELLFEPNAETVTPRLSADGAQRLAKVAAELARRYPRNVYCIAGYHDRSIPDVSGADRTLRYTYEKASVVSDWLVTHASISGDRIQVSSRGCTSPITTNATDSGKKRNRRVEWIVRAASFSGA